MSRARVAKAAGAGTLARQLLERGVYDVEGFEGWLRGRDWAWQGIDRGDYGLDLNQALVLFTIEDPVRWGETYMIEPDTGEPYRFFDYQRESIRSYDQNVVHKDAAEVGKTREIVCILLWACCTAMGGRIVRPSCLVGAPMQIFLDEIILAIEEQMGVAKGLNRRTMLTSSWLEPKRTPHTKLRFACPNPRNPSQSSIATIDFRPAGHDGEAFRGVHVNALALVDEAAKMKAKVHWTEFYRAMKPGCRLRVYSVPDGDRTTEFFRLGQQAVQDLQPGEEGIRLFRWPKTVMPEPFWSEERDRHFVQLYGGRDTAGYKRNVLGEDGDAENPVVRWGVLLPNVVELPDYRALVLAADDGADLLHLQAHRVSLNVTEGRKSGQLLEVGDTSAHLRPFIHEDDETRRAYLAELLAPFLGAMDCRGVYYAGADLGERNDPTEIIISEEVGGLLVDRLRVKARGLPYHAQEELIFQLDRAFGHRPVWGIDLGSAGTAVVKNLRTGDRYAAAQFDDRMFGFHFQEAVDCIDEDGEALRASQEDENGETKILRAPAKHWATVCLVQRLQRVGYRLAYDPDVLNDYTSHTARSGTKWPIYAKTNDHTIDARRQQMLAKLRHTQADAHVDVFSVSAYQRRVA